VLAVPPEARGTGVGRLLTQWCIDRARAAGAASMIIHTTDYMDVAQAMYQRMGFERDERLDFQIERPPVHVKGYRLALAVAP
jgi:ribosomal protein S18 acetylase RimI-like enzyme